MLEHYDYAQIHDLSLAKDLAELEPVCCSRLKALGIKHFRYGWQHAELPGRVPQDIDIMSCPAAWLDHYKKMGYAEIDPKRAYVRKNSVAAVWGPDLHLGVAPASEHQFWMDSADFGLGYGATIPVPSKFGERASLCVAFSTVRAERDFALNCMPSIEAFAFRLHEVVERLTVRRLSLEVNLTKREVDVVKWAAAGKTAYETGRILAISETTVLFHLNNAKLKFGVTNKHQLIARSLALGVYV